MEWIGVQKEWSGLGCKRNGVDWGAKGMEWIGVQKEWSGLGCKRNGVDWGAKIFITYIRYQLIIINV
jgi:hypothetical protein